MTAVRRQSSLVKVMSLHTVKNNGFVRRVNIERVIQRKRRGVIIQSCISARVVNGYRCMRQTSHELLNPADTLRPRDRRPVSRVVPEGYVHCVIEAFPLLLGEKRAER